jgi:hypothetical protein
LIFSTTSPVRFPSPEAGGLPGWSATVEHTVEQMVPLDPCWSLRLPLCLLRLRAEAVPATGREQRQQSWLWAPLDPLETLKATAVPRRTGSCPPSGPRQRLAPRCRSCGQAIPAGVSSAMTLVNQSGFAFMRRHERNAKVTGRLWAGVPSCFATMPIPDPSRTPCRCGVNPKAPPARLQARPDPLCRRSRQAAVSRPAGGGGWSGR